MKIIQRIWLIASIFMNLLLLVYIATTTLQECQSLYRDSSTQQIDPPPPAPSAKLQYVFEVSSMETRKQIWDIATRIAYPSVVSPGRKVLTMELAYFTLVRDIPGDFVETGVFTGGTSILMYKALERWDSSRSRLLYSCDSFEGLPDTVNQDKNGALNVGARGEFKFTLDNFKANLARYGAANYNKVKIIKGWFSESLPKAGISRISFLRLDGDLYASTMDALNALYKHISPGGIVYVDDYYSFNGCRTAVDEFRSTHNITEPLHSQGFPEGDSYLKQVEAVWWMKGYDETVE